MIGLVRGGDRVVGVYRVVGGVRSGDSVVVCDCMIGLVRGGDRVVGGYRVVSGVRVGDGVVLVRDVGLVRSRSDSVRDLLVGSVVACGFVLHRGVGLRLVGRAVLGVVHG